MILRAKMRREQLQQMLALSDYIFDAFISCERRDCINYVIKGILPQFEMQKVSVTPFKKQLRRHLPPEIRKILALVQTTNDQYKDTIETGLSQQVQRNLTQESDVNDLNSIDESIFYVKEKIMEIIDICFLSFKGMFTDLVYICQKLMEDEVFKHLTDDEVVLKEEVKKQLEDNEIEMKDKIISHLSESHHHVISKFSTEFTVNSQRLIGEIKELKQEKFGKIKNALFHFLSLNLKVVQKFLAEAATITEQIAKDIILEEFRKVAEKLNSERETAQASKKTKMNFCVAQRDFVVGVTIIGMPIDIFLRFFVAVSVNGMPNKILLSMLHSSKILAIQQGITRGVSSVGKPCRS